MLWLSVGTVFINLLLLILVLLRFIKYTNGFLILSYVFTFSMYLPAINADEVTRQSIINDFTNLGACFIIVFNLGLLGFRLHVLILAAMNVLLMLWVYLTDPKHLDLNFINIVLFFSVSIVMYYFLIFIENALKKYEFRKNQAYMFEKKIAEMNKKEEEERISYVTMINMDNKRFINAIIKGLTDIYNEKNENLRERLIADQINECKIYKIYNTQLEDKYPAQEFDSDFNVKLKNINPDLTDTELLICSLLKHHLTTKEISQKMGLADETVKWYRKRIRKKLNLPKSVRLTKYLVDLSANQLK